MTRPPSPAHALRTAACCALLSLLAIGSLAARVPVPQVAIDPVTGVVGVDPPKLTAAYWIARQRQPDRVLLDRAGIAAQNARMRRDDPAIHDLRALPAQLPRAQVVEAIQALSVRPTRALYGLDGQALDAAALDALQASLALDAVPAATPLRYGLVTHRADLRTFPTARRVFSSVDDHDIDRFQESALFPGDAVAVLHESRDGQWLFVTSERYSAWIEKRFVGLGSAQQVFDYGARGPYRVVTGATATTVFTPEQPQVSQLQLDMGVRVPVLADWAPTQPVNGQLPYTAWVIQLPIRNADGSLALVPALLPRTADTAADYLPLTPGHFITQAFKFLGERYGWGHSYDARDCSGFTSEVYRSFGVLLPRNTSQQAVSPALDRIAFAPDDPDAKRLTAVGQLALGDLVYIPGHVMVVLGHANGLTYVIHDTAGGGWAGADGKRVAGHLNGVSVTPLEPMLASDTASYVDRITNIQRIRPKAQE
ncbi:SH3 domain-containing protein [Pseudoxanthomonas winnipegensis]|uniref:NlpC-P60 family protein n=1 Tax=Pseudoxanthomonas winnipegensis TaxID=2480810 RepID=A0A4Q8LL55_9GAMM|nr:SH3 domain-containing protein [Pseudoxanthomonas winnipegensis]RZZ85153.1 NlpC-P60 family protein [Pseudoxanthomonas winnipegensis]TAA30932.1 NlpC-P60 family protein [Pseudoxanthomonas winnipegensis]TAA38713.1 NlpC-P60 family protein [Pseudoxanthomonas winnipegensis]TBV77745.1 NlpC-P60 family protein [Pseudoxanthomonas winnipegensis]